MHMVLILGKYSLYIINKVKYNSHSTDPRTGLWRGHIVGCVVGQHCTDDSCIHVEAMVRIWRVLGPLQEGTLKLQTDPRD